MAIFRAINIDYWQDGFILELTPEEKYFYIYLMTNSKSNQCGIFELAMRIMEIETGFNRETITKYINRFVEYGKIIFDEETKEIFIVNWIKYNNNKGVKVIKCIEKELKAIKSKKLKSMFLESCKKYNYNINPSVILEDNEGSLEIYNKSATEENLQEDIFICTYKDKVENISPKVIGWIEEIKDNIDYELFNRAIDIALERNKVSQGYINAIICSWRENNIYTLKDLDTYERTLKSKKENSYGKNKPEYSKSKPTREYEEENESIYERPSEEQLKRAREL